MPINFKNVQSAFFELLIMAGIQNAIFIHIHSFKKIISYILNLKGLYDVSIA